MDGARRAKFCARNGVRLDGTKLYSTAFPCADCARTIIQAGISEVVVGSWCIDSGPQWEESFAVASEMLAEAGVRVRGME